MNLNKEIATRIKAYRKRFGYSQEQVADMLGMVRVNYVNMEAGRHSCMTKHLYNLCRIFKCTPTDLFPKIKPLKLKSKTVTRRVTRIKSTKKYFKV